jgi:hypothetical protein
MGERKRHLKELAADPRFITGIHNYCDRWCEHCPLTSRCLAYAMEQGEGVGDPAARDIRNQAFWRHTEEILRETKEMLEELMEAHSIVLEPLDADAERALTAWHDEAQAHPHAQAGADYAGIVDAWFDQAEGCFATRGEALALQERMGLASADPAEDARRLRDAAEIIRWYQYQIPVKIVRAIGSAQRDKLLDLPHDPGDADGSAKVALLGMDRSLVAWSEVLRQLPGEEDRTLPLLASLSRLRRDVETAFPHARAFLRPGFDTGEGTEAWTCDTDR